VTRRLAPRTVTLALTLTALALVVPAPSAAAAAKTLPVVNMAALDAAAQVEGYRGNQPALGDDASTKLVQRALTSRGFRVAVDGEYGRATTRAYTKFQRSLGYRTIDANGIPGPESLAVLGAGRFTIAHVVQVGSRTDTFYGARVSSRTRTMLIAADRAVPWKVRLVQGSYCGLVKARCAAASGGTHDGGGVVDVSVRGMSATRRWQTVRALRRVGFAAWLRTPSQCGGCWSSHIHAVAIGDTDLWQRNGAYTNRDQVADYFVGRIGLSGHKRDNTPVRYRVPFTTWEQYAAL
jgi:peptidoglycan hydrolase-like protein with peptidoglycan-binding domain